MVDVTSKRDLRREIKKTWANLSSADHERKSRALSANLKKSLSHLLPQSVGAFAPLDGEPLWHLVLDQKNYHFAFPAISQAEMTFFPAQLSDLQESEEFGVKLKTPRERAAAVQPELMLVPGLAFTREGLRLGRGKGFYDRYLANYPGLKIGLCFSEHIVEHIPCEPHDQKVNLIITDQEVIEAGNSQKKRGGL